MKTCISLAVMFVGMASVEGATEADYSYAAEIMEMAETAPEWDDCIDDVSATNEIEVLYPTVESLFACQMPSNSCAHNWSVLEKQRSFDSFLMSFSTTNVTLLSRRDEHCGFIALMCCLEKKYTNSLSAAKCILQSQSSPYKWIAMDILRELQPPGMEMNSLVLGMITNHNAATAYDRCAALSSYVESLTVKSAVDRGVVTNAANLFYSARNNIESHIPIDRLMLLAVDGYSNSLQRLSYAQEVLSSPEVSDNEKDYFTEVTNRWSGLLEK